MELTKQRKVYVAILSIAGLALGIDRLVLDGGPSAARASEVQGASLGVATSADVSLPAVKASGVRPGTLEAPLAALARRIDRLPRTDGPTDAFTVPESWPGAATGSEARSEGARGNESAVHLPYRLTSVTAQAAVVLIENAPADNNTRFLRLGGEAQEGMRLVSLSLATKDGAEGVTRAVIEVGSQQFTLTLSPPQSIKAPMKSSSRITPKNPRVGE